jgi:hypothetical protein
MIVGIDARPALHGQSGFARVARELLVALARRPGLELRVYAAAWRRVRHDLPARAGALRAARQRMPARLQQALTPLGFGVETLLGPLDPAGARVLLGRRGASGRVGRGGVWCPTRARGRAH